MAVKKNDGLGSLMVSDTLYPNFLVVSGGTIRNYDHYKGERVGLRASGERLGAGWDRLGLSWEA